MYIVKYIEFNVPS